MIRDEINVSHLLIKLKAKCSACKQANHLLENCNLLHFCPDKEKIIKKYEFSHPQGRTKRKKMDFSKLSKLLPSRKI